MIFTQASVLCLLCLLCVCVCVVATGETQSNPVRFKVSKVSRSVWANNTHGHGSTISLSIDHIIVFLATTTTCLLAWKLFYPWIFFHWTACFTLAPSRGLAYEEFVWRIGSSQWIFDWLIGHHQLTSFNANLLLCCMLYQLIDQWVTSGHSLVVWQVSITHGLIVSWFTLRKRASVTLAKVARYLSLTSSE